MSSRKNFQNTPDFLCKVMNGSDFFVIECYTDKGILVYLYYGPACLYNDCNICCSAASVTVLGQ